MSNYTKAINFATKDSLTTGNPLKTLSGTELDDEFNAISVANATKANANNAALTGVPVAPTAASGTSTTQLATTAFVTEVDVLKAPLASPALTGTPTAPTAAADTSTTQLATTAFVTTEANLKADLASPTFTGVPAAPTAAADTSTTQVATTAFVTTEANLKADLAGAAFTGAITTTSTIDGVDIATRDGVLSATTVTADAALPKAGGTVTGDTLHGDNVKAKFGTAPDLEIYHDGSHSIISDIGAGGLKVKASDVYIRNTADVDMIHATSGGHVKLYNNGSEKLATTSTGVDVTGTVTADGLVVDRSSTNGDIVTLKKDGTTVGTIGTGASEIFIGSNDAYLWTSGNNNSFLPASTSVGGASDGLLDLGSTGRQFKDVYAYGTVNAGTLVTTGNVGIGTSSPSTALEVSGAVTVTRSDVASDNSTISNEGGLFVISAASGGGGGSYPMLFKTVNTEAMRIDTSGNVGIGVTPSTAWHSNHVALQLGGGKDGFISAPKGQNIGRMFMGVNAVSTDATGNNWSRGGDTYRPSLYSQINGVHAFKTAAAGSGAISWDTAMTIDNSGNLLVGTTTKETQGVTLYGSGANGMYLKSTGTCAYMITQSGTGGAGTLQTFYSNTTSVGSITTSGTSTSYNTASDHRLKADVQPMTGATATFMQLNPVNFEWIADGTRVDGFLAHELGEVIPAAATGSKDAMMDEEYEVSPATGDVYTAASAEVATESQVMETVEAGSYVNLAGETIVETEERGVTTDLVETIVQRQDVNGVSTEVEVEVTTKVPTMETVITTPAVAEVIHISDVELPENLEEGQQWRETTAQVMATRSVPDMQGIDQAKVVPLLVATIQELIARIEALEA